MIRCTCQPGAPGISAICLLGERCSCTFHRCAHRGHTLAPEIVEFANSAFHRMTSIPTTSELETNQQRVMDPETVSAVIILNGGQRVEVIFRAA